MKKVKLLLMEPVPTPHHSNNSSHSLRRDSNAPVVCNMTAHSLCVYEFYQNTLLKSSPQNPQNKTKEKR